MSINLKVKHAIGIALALTSLQAMSQDKGPFGVSMGMSIEDIIQKLPAEAERYIENDFLVSDTAPEPVAILDGMYFFIATKETGLCRASAQTKPTKSEQSAVSSYNIIKNALTEKYGQPKSSEGENRGQYNLIPALTLERTVYASVWDKDLPQDLMMIALDIKVEERFLSAFIRVTYSFTNQNKCSVIINKKRTQGL